MTLRRTIALLLLPLFVFFIAACTDGPGTFGTWFGASDKPLLAPVIEEVLCDPSAGSTCSEATLREVLGIALGQAAERPGSVVRLWVQGRDMETTRMVGEARSVKARGSGRRARVEHESRWTAEELRSLMTAAQPSLRLHPRRSPIAEAIGRVALATPAMKEPRLLIVVTDAFEVSDFGSFECDALPTPERFARTLARERVLPPGSLRGISVIFSHVDLGSVDRGRCALTLRRAADVRAIWQTALHDAGAAHVEIQSGSYQARQPPERRRPMFERMLEGFDRNDLDQRAREDARLNIYEPDAYVLATLGPEPSFDPVGNLRHANVGSHLQDPRIEEGEADIRGLEEDLARHPNAHFLIAFLIVLLFVESAGAIYVMRAIGIDLPERIVFGTALAACVFFTAWLLSRARNRVVSIAALLSLGLSHGRADRRTRRRERRRRQSRSVDWAMGIIMTGYGAKRSLRGAN